MDGLPTDEQARVLEWLENGPGYSFWDLLRRVLIAAYGPLEPEHGEESSE